MVNFLYLLFSLSVWWFVICRCLSYWFVCCGGLVCCVAVDLVLCWLLGWCCVLRIARLVVNSVGGVSYLL